MYQGLGGSALFRGVAGWEETGWAAQGGGEGRRAVLLCRSGLSPQAAVPRPPWSLGGGKRTRGEERGLGARGRHPPVRLPRLVVFTAAGMEVSNRFRWFCYQLAVSPRSHLASAFVLRTAPALPGSSRVPDVSGTLVGPGKRAVNGTEGAVGINTSLFLSDH